MDNPDGILNLTGYSYLTETEFINEDIKSQLYSQYNLQGGLYPLASWSPGSCCISLQNGDELGYGAPGNSPWMLIASSDETDISSNGSPCSKNKAYDVNKIYQVVPGPHPGKKISSLDTAYDITSDGIEYCPKLTAVSFVYKCSYEAEEAKLPYFNNNLNKPNNNGYYLQISQSTLMYIGELLILILICNILLLCYTNFYAKHKSRGYNKVKYTDTDSEV